MNSLNRCPNCGGQLQISSDKRTATCAYCDSLFSITKDDKHNFSNDFTIVAGQLIEYTGSDTAVVIPNEVIKIGKRAFFNLSLLESVYIPDSVIEIDDSAFCGCINLKEVRLSSNLKRIGLGVFLKCDRIVFSNAESLNHITKKFFCPICGEVYEGNQIPPGFRCPVCNCLGTNFK